MAMEAAAERSKQASSDVSATEGLAWRAFAEEIRARLGPVPELGEQPLVSVIVLNRDGVGCLRRMLAGLSERTDYSNFELILVDNASSDDSLELARTVRMPFPISILANPFNESFADGCNQGAELASGDLLLFLNNDIEPFEPGWLHELIACLRSTRAGSVGSTLLQRAAPGSCRPYVVQQRGLRARDAGLLTSAHRDPHADPLGEGLGRDAEVGALAGACVLVERDAFELVGGFTHGYWYGPEDVDLSLKLREWDRPPVCSGRSFLIHPAGSTLKEMDQALRGSWARGNAHIFMERWGPRTRREYELDRLDGNGVWTNPTDSDGGASEFTRAELEALGFCFRAAAPADEDALGATSMSLEELCGALAEGGRRAVALRDAPSDDLMALEYDVAVHLRGPNRPIPKLAQLNVLWAVSEFDALSAGECIHHDLVLTGDETLSRRLRAEDLPEAMLASPSGASPLDLAASIVAVVEARAREVDFRTRIGPE